MDSRVKVGATVFLEYDGKIQEQSIAKVGRKWFAVSNLAARFNIETLEHDYGQYSQLRINIYFDKQEILDKREVSRLRGEIWRFFNRSSTVNVLTLDQLRRIDEITKEAHDA